MLFWGFFKGNFPQVSYACGPSWAFCFICKYTCHVNIKIKNKNPGKWHVNIKKQEGKTQEYSRDHLVMAIAKVRIIKWQSVRPKKFCPQTHSPRMPFACRSCSYRVRLPLLHVCTIGILWPIIGHVWCL